MMIVQRSLKHADVHAALFNSPERVLGDAEAHHQQAPAGHWGERWALIPVASIQMGTAFCLDYTDKNICGSSDGPLNETGVNVGYPKEASFKGSFGVSICAHLAGRQDRPQTKGWPPTKGSSDVLCAQS